MFVWARTVFTGIEGWRRGLNPTRIIYGERFCAIGSLKSDVHRTCFCSIDFVQLLYFIFHGIYEGEQTQPL